MGTNLSPLGIIGFPRNALLEFLSVTRITDDSEAEKQGVKPGWAFSKVAGMPVGGLTLEKIVTLILENSVHLPMEK